MNPDEASRSMARDTALARSLSVASWMCALTCLVVFIVALGSMHPPRASADPMGVSGVQ